MKAQKLFFRDLVRNVKRIEHGDAAKAPQVDLALRALCLLFAIFAVKSF